MDTKALASFAAVYEDGSMLKAAQRLYISPQGLSKAIARLEGELGYELFMRTHEGVVPTVYARSLYPRVRELTAMLESIQDTDALDRPNSELRVFAVSGVLAYTGLGFLHDFEAEHPDAHLVLDEGNDELVCGLVREGKVEVAFSAGPVDVETFDAEPFSSHPHVLVVNEADPVAEKGFATYADLEGRTVMTLCAGYSPNLGVRARLAKAGVHPRETVGFAETYTGLIMAQRGEAVVVSTDYAAFLQPWPGTRILPFEDPSFTWDVYLITRRGATLSPRARTFKEYALGWARAHKDALFHWPENDPSRPFAH